MIIRQIRRLFPADWAESKIRGGADHAIKVCSIPRIAHEHSQIVKRKGEHWMEFTWSWEEDG